MSFNQALDLANPASDISAFNAIEECWKEHPQCKAKLVGLTTFAGLTSILGVGIATPLIFRTIVFCGVKAIEESESVRDYRDGNRFFPLTPFSDVSDSRSSEETGSSLSDRTDSERFFPL